LTEAGKDRESNKSLFDVAVQWDNVASLPIAYESCTAVYKDMPLTAAAHYPKHI